MQYRWYVFVASLTSMIVGFGLAMLFIQSYAVPNFLYRMNNFPAMTECFVDEARTDGEGACTQPGCHPQHQPASPTCLNFPLVFKTGNGSLKDGFLVPKHIAEDSGEKV